jgi:hypothetical protein
MEKYGSNRLGTVIRQFQGPGEESSGRRITRRFYNNCSRKKSMNAIVRAERRRSRLSTALTGSALV